MKPKPTALPPGPFNLIYGDPAWKYENEANSDRQWGGAASHYPTMTITELKRLPVEHIAAPDCLLALWWVAPMPQEALDLVAAWGFKIKTMTGFTWHKTTVNGLDHFGQGRWTRANAENCLFAVRGKPKRECASVRQIIHACRREHSRKPDEARDRLIHLCGDVPRIELFARQRNYGWTVWGNEVPRARENRSKSPPAKNGRA